MQPQSCNPYHWRRPTAFMLFVVVMLAATGIRLVGAQAATARFCLPLVMIGFALALVAGPAALRLGCCLGLIGVGMNAVVLSANSWKMSVAGLAKASGIHVLMTADTKLNVLGDWIFGCSPGDLVLAAGLGFSVGELLFLLRAVGFSSGESFT